MNKTETDRKGIRQKHKERKGKNRERQKDRNITEKEKNTVKHAHTLWQTQMKDT